MLYGAPITLEVRSEAGATRLRGAFPYGAETALGEGRRERFAPGAFRSRIASGENIFLFAGHDPEKPLASTEAGSLSLRDGDDALHIEARVAPTTSWAQDALAALAAGLTKGLSPGFRVPSGGDTVTRAGDGLLRTVRNADLYEVSLVTLPAYDAAQVSARSWALSASMSNAATCSHLRRWRA
jgi:HK97 family phage prohead protease